ncbi:tRNA 2-selenouridine(34) synthase MnmH [Campylobacter sp. CCS1377]|uniref:tRNA 2-selenouridine(34) synthase MnmH n=1 Tax=Campylobacter sp. CCS1377 TaxID=3158229 RepID=A0AAU7E5G4_9BACT
MLSDSDFLEFKKHQFDLLIDARSPNEFHHSHLPNALNFYALNNLEHQEVGILYRKNQALAKSKGAQYICANMAKHIPKLTKHFHIGSKIGIYCAHGGLRSKSIAVILSELGYRVVRLKGGFKAYRAFLNESFVQPLYFDLFSLCGNTGSGKTELLRLLPNAIDLEKMANHLGSSFGDILGDQPTQKAFEARLFEQISKIKQYAFIESESRKIGNIILPLKLYESMCNAYKIHCFCSLENRIMRIEHFYKARINEAKFQECIRRISPYISMNFRLDLLQAYKKEQWQKLIAMLLEYYDKVYKKPSRVDFKLDTNDITKAKNELLAFVKEKMKLKI